MVLLKGINKYKGYFAAVTPLDNGEAKITMLFPGTGRAKKRIIEVWETKHSINNPALWIWNGTKFQIVSQ